MLSTNVSNKPDEVMDLLIRARSIKGAPIPRNLIAKCFDLCVESEYNFVIPSGTALSRKKSFFQLHKDELKFFNQNGIQFEFDRDCRESIRNETFVAVHFDEASKEATIYAYFPCDGAVR